MGNCIKHLCCQGDESRTASALDECSALKGLSSEQRREMLENMFSKEINYKDFKTIKLLGKGSFGEVILVNKIDENKLYAMKILKKQLIKMQNHVTHTKSEREILEQLDHPFLVSLQFAFQTPEKLYLVTEFMQGGELFFHLRKERFFSVARAKFYAAEILLALAYMHDKNTIYRDLKPENVLLGLDGHVKLTDFGLSKVLITQESERTYTLCGTPEYLAPEVLKDEGYGKEVDWWSFGVLLYVMLTGSSPFKNARNNKGKLEYKFYVREVNYPGYMDVKAVDLIQKLLIVEGKHRLGYRGWIEVKEHTFFEDIDFEKTLKKEIKAPFKPYVKNEFDLSNFDRGFTEEEIKNSEFDKTGEGMYAEKYENFTYVKESIFQ